MEKVSDKVRLIRKDCIYFENRVDLLRTAINRVAYDGYSLDLAELDRIEEGYLNNNNYFLNILVGGVCEVEYICEDFEGQLLGLEQDLYNRYPLVKQVRGELFEMLFEGSSEKSKK